MQKNSLKIHLLPASFCFLLFVLPKHPRNQEQEFNGTATRFEDKLHRGMNKSNRFIDPPYVWGQKHQRAERLGATSLFDKNGACFEDVEKSV